MPLDLTGIQNVGEFYSHHYLDALLENDLKGLLAGWREEDEQTPDRRLYRAANDFFAAKSRALRESNPVERYGESHKLHVELLEALGYDYAFDVRYLSDDPAIPILSAVKRDGRDYIWLVETVFTGADEAPLDLPLYRVQFPHGEQEIEMPAGTWEEIIGDIFHRDEPPRWVILFAGRLIYLLDRTKWGYGQYLLFDLDEIFGRRQTQTLRAVAALLAREALCPDEGVPLHDTLDENSHKHAYGVSTDLKYGVRRAVELLANEYIWYKLKQHEKVISEENLAKQLTREALTYLYRLLFLFYAEARGGELDVAPMKSDAYRLGYSIESLRDLEQAPLTTPQSQDGYFIHESVKRLFELVNEGYQPQQLQLMQDDAQAVYDDYGFRLNGVHSPLFSPESTPLLSKAKFRNVVLQEVLQLLSLSREKRGKAKRGRISYAQLGINQLGAVYEGLLSYTGFFAQEKLYEVKPADAQAADETAQTYFIPESEIARYEADEFVYAESADGSRVRKTYPKGSFIFRLAGRDREKLASYYTPEVLTQCVVKYSLKELLRDKSADDILQLVFCEMALGSGAFANEMLNQLADAYLERKQKELDKRIAPDDYREERQKVKAYLAARNLYGVDLNPTAIELARVSIWLNIIYRDAPAPWFGARLAVGNSLIGARHQVYAAQDVLSGAYQSRAPTPIPLNEPRPAGSVYHWLLPDAGMAAFDNDKVIKELAPDEVSHLKAWRKEFTKKITAEELKNLQALSDRADALWAQHVSQRQSLLERTRTEIQVWGRADERRMTTDESEHSSSVVRRSSSGDVNAKDKELEQLYRPTSPFRRLKMAMDYWCALWFWRIPKAKQLPTRQQFWNDIADLFAGVESEFVKPPEQMTLLEEMTAPKQAHFADLKPANVDDLCRTNARLKLASDVTEQTRFHHWELVFAEVFVTRGGFDALIGNPPWVKLTWNEGGILSEYDPLLAVRKKSASEIAEQRNQQLNNSERTYEYADEFSSVVGSISYFTALGNYPLLKGIQSNLYKCFVTKAWQLGSSIGTVGLLHPESIYDDPNGGSLREEIYPRLKSHFQFHNELVLFAEVDHHTKYSVNVYRTLPQPQVHFDHVVNLFHASTIDRCYGHDGLGAVPGIRDSEDQWELRGHKSRIVKIDEMRLNLFARLYDIEVGSPLRARLPIIHSEELVDVLEHIASQSRRLGDLSEHYYPIRMWDETGAQKEGLIKRETRYPTSVIEWIVSGPHFSIATPFNKNPNEECRSNLDYSDIDLVTIADNFLPRTNFIPGSNGSAYSQRTPKWHGIPITQQYRYVNRKMLSQTGERTLISAILPPGAGSLGTVFSINFDNSTTLATFSGLCSSVVYDFFVKSTGKSDMLNDLASLLPLPASSIFTAWIVHRNLRLNCLTTHYAELWEELYTPAFNQDDWTKQDARLKLWNDLTAHWQRHVALRTPFERRQALVEIDVLAALALNLTLDELVTIYRVQFPVLQKNERRLRFDQRGMEVPMKTISGELVPDENHPKFAEMVPPFTSVDREADYREAWRVFEGRMKDEG